MVSEFSRIIVKDNNKPTKTKKMIHITKDNFVWLDITSRNIFSYPQCNSMTRILELNNVHELYEVGDDGTDHLIENVADIPRIISEGARICIEVGYLPTT